jgi:hypothetical protein
MQSGAKQTFQTSMAGPGGLPMRGGRGVPLGTPRNSSTVRGGGMRGGGPDRTGGAQMAIVCATRASGRVMQLVARKHHARAQRLDEI